MNPKLQSFRENWNTYFLYFLVYSFIGWIYEVLVFWLEFHEGYVNRGFLFGPYLPVYGVGGLLILLMLRRFRERRIPVGSINVTPLLCFVWIVAVTTTVELITSYLMEWVIGTWLWDYTMDIPNFEGRIALKSSLRFGIIGFTGLYFLQPVMEKVFLRIRQEHTLAYRILSGALAAIFLADVIARFFLGSNYYMT